MNITARPVIGAYYAIFYAASALLYSKGKSYGKHSAVLAAFRQFFIKTGEFEKKWSDHYEFVMDSRHTADYDLYDSLEKDDVVMAIAKAQEFVRECFLIHHEGHKEHTPHWRRCSEGLIREGNNS